jgi:hypothetical protein
VSVTTKIILIHCDECICYVLKGITVYITKNNDFLFLKIFQKGVEQSKKHIPQYKISMESGYINQKNTKYIVTDS